MGSVSSKLNWLRAGVLGANDGIISTAGIVVGVAAATAARGPILTAGIAGLVAGAVSMALGEYVSVSTQRDTEQALLSKERDELRDEPAAELDELAALYEAKGLSTATARTVAEELTDHDAFTAHAEVELGIDPEELTNPWHAALSSALSFTFGALLPLIAIILPPTALRIPVTFVAVLTGVGDHRIGVGAIGEGPARSSRDPQRGRRWSRLGDHLRRRPCGRRRDRLTVELWEDGSPARRCVCAKP